MHTKQSMLKNGMHLFEYNPELALGKVLHVCLQGLYSIYVICTRHGRIQTGGTDPLPPLENHKNIGFLCNNGPNTMKNH